MPNQNAQFNNDEEILVRDESGQFKILRGGELRAYIEKQKTEPLITAPATAPTTIPIDTGMEEPMLQPPPPAIRKPTATFYFHPEDEEEVAKIKAQTVEPAIGKRYSIDKVINKVIENYQLPLNQELKLRFRNIVFSYLRDRRTLVDFQEVLVRSEVDGGMSLSLDQVEKITFFLKEIKEKIETESGLVVDEEQEEPISTRPLKQVFRPQATKLKAVPPVKKLVTEAAPISSEIKKIPLPRSARFQRPVKRGQMTDVKKDYKLFGPVEELSSLDLETFRRLGASIEDRAEKIIRKVDSLAQVSLTKKAAGLKAWRNSPLYRMYLAVGQAGMEHQVPIAKIIEQYQAAGKDILSLNEFEVISDINRKLRF